MTASELKEFLFNIYGYRPYPDTYEVDADTYANVCQEIFNNKITNDHNYSLVEGRNYYSMRIEVGKISKGIMFKGVELILKVDKE